MVAKTIMYRRAMIISIVVVFLCLILAASLFLLLTSLDGGLLYRSGIMIIATKFRYA